jgi:PAS domain S-box-containing protein
MYDFNPTEAASDSLFHIADSGYLQSHEPANSRPAGVERVTELEPLGRRMDDRLHQANAGSTQGSEDRYRDLFDEAPIAYVHQGIDTRFIRANRTAMKILGVKPGEITGLGTTSFVPDNPEAQRGLRDVLKSWGRGTDTNGVVLELRRKDDGRPLWVRWWSRPEPGASYTRSMFIDITDQVLIEQEKKRLEAQNAYLLDEIRSEHDFGDIIGKFRHARGYAAGSTRRADRRHGADHWRKRYGQRARRSRDP